jgi:hypothetical protein
MQQSQSDHLRDHQPMLGPQQQQLLNQRRRPSLLQSAAVYGADYGFNSPAHFQYLNSLQERYLVQLLQVFETVKLTIVFLFCFL